MTEFPQDWGNRNSWRAHTHTQTQTCVHQTQKKGAGTPQETEPDSSVSVWKTPAEAWVDCGLPLVKGN